MVKDEGALRFVSMDEEEEKRLKIIQAILQQILSLQQLPLGITLDQGSPPSSDDHLSFKFLFPQSIQNFQFLPNIAGHPSDLIAHIRHLHTSLLLHHHLNDH